MDLQQTKKNLKTDFDFRPPEGCTQWFTEPSGTISDWGGADNILQDGLNYNICVRQNYGYCCVEYQVCNKKGA